MDCAKITVARAILAAGTTREMGWLRDEGSPNTKTPIFVPSSCGKREENRLGVAQRLPYVPADVSQFLGRGVFQAFPLPIEVFVDLHSRLLHDGMSILASAKQDEILPPCQPGVAIIVVEGQPQQGGRFLWRIGSFHGLRNICLSMSAAADRLLAAVGLGGGGGPNNGAGFSGGFSASASAPAGAAPCGVAVSG